MCVAAALAVCARDGKAPNDTIAVTIAIPIVANLGASLKTFIATLPWWTDSGFRRICPRKGAIARKSLRFSGSIEAASRGDAPLAFMGRSCLKAGDAPDKPSDPHNA